MNTSTVSASSVPIGFRSFAEDENKAAGALDQSFAVLNATQGPQEISFAQSEACEGVNVTNVDELEANDSLPL